MKILYFSLVDWRWIKQRPHHIAEGLADSNDVTFVCKRIFTRGVLTDNINEKKNLKLFRFFAFPVSLIRNDFVFNLASAWFRLMFMLFRLTRYDRIILTYPLHYSWIPHSILKRTFILYDCMDSHTDFDMIPFMKMKIEELEAELVNRADAVVVSSRELSNRLIQKYQGLIDNKITVINNGVDTDVFSDKYLSDQLPLSDSKLRQVKKTYKATIGYVGTIADWIDWQTILKASLIFNDMAFCFVGPIGSEPPKVIVDKENIFFFGPVPYKSVPLYLNEFDILLYPFILNDIILAVDPVKIYEYLAMNKPVICINNSETLKFAGYVRLYNNSQEFLDAISYYRTSDKKLNSRSFALDENWNVRIQQFMKVMAFN